MRRFQFEISKFFFEFLKETNLTQRPTYSVQQQRNFAGILSVKKIFEVFVEATYVKTILQHIIDLNLTQKQDEWAGF